MVKRTTTKTTTKAETEAVSEGPVQPELTGDTPPPSPPDISVMNAGVAGSLSLEVTTDNAIANGEAQAAIRATVTDSEGESVADVDVSFSVTGSAVLSTESGSTNGQGRVTANLTNTVVEAVIVTATVEDLDPETADVTFVAIPPVTLTIKNNSTYGVDILLQRGNLNIKGCETTGPITLQASEAEWLREYLARFPAIQITENSE